MVECNRRAVALEDGSPTERSRGVMGIRSTDIECDWEEIQKPKPKM